MPTPPNRLEVLRKFVAAKPDDPFPRYGLAMELKNAGLHEEARQAFAALEARAPDYIAQYYHYASLLLDMGLREEARAVIERGIPAAEKKGDAHAAGELRGLLDSI